MMQIHNLRPPPPPKKKKKKKKQGFIGSIPVSQPSGSASLAYDLYAF